MRRLWREACEAFHTPLPGEALIVAALVLGWVVSLVRYIN